MTTEIGARPGEREAVRVALMVERARTSAVSEPITEAMIAAAYPLIAAAVRESIAEQIEAARAADYLKRQGERHGACDVPHWQCHASGSHVGYSFAARIARGETA